ncbi:MAG TPA: hypothetical protein EYG38_17520 [Verrucomicrobia bacterium]|nr:hypothetical protein [Verrucomicrobiota bacterium]
MAVKKCPMGCSSGMVIDSSG